MKASIHAQYSKIAKSIKSATTTGTTSNFGNFTSDIKISERVVLCAFANTNEGISVIPYVTTGQVYYQVKMLVYDSTPYANKNASVTYYYIDK